MCHKIKPNHIYLIYMYKPDLSSNNLQPLMCHKTKPIKTADKKTVKNRHWLAETSSLYSTGHDRNISHILNYHLGNASEFRQVVMVAPSR